MQDVTPKRNSNVQILDNTIIPQSASLHRSSSTEVENVMTIRDIFSVIARRKLLLLSMVLLALTLSLYYTFSVKPSYRANAILQIEREGAQIVNFGQTKKASEVFDNDPFFKTRYEILKSRVVAQRVIDELNLRDSLENKDNKNLYSFAAITGLFKNIFSKNKQPKNSVDHVGLFQKNLHVQPIQGTQLVEVYYEAFSPDEARDIIASILKNFIKLQIETVSDTDEYAKEFLGKQLISSRDKLNKSEEALVQFANINGILKVDDKQSRHIKKLENLDDALVKAELKRIETESLFLQMDKTGSISRISTNPILLNLEAKLFQVESDYQKKLQSLKANHPDMQSLKKLITSTKSKINKELENIKTSTEADFLTAQRQEQRVREELSQFKQEMHQLQNKNLEYSALKRDVETNEKIYNNLLQRLEEVNVASAANTSNISIIEPPITPLERYRPNTKLNTLIGLFSGLVLGLGLVFLRESFDQSIRSHEDLEKKSGLPVLGRIPRVTRKSRSQLDMIVSKAPNDPISEAYRILSANIQLLVSRSAERIIMITSAHSGDGKSITASNVACAFAQSGKRVLLIDADIRRPSLHKILDLKNEAGLSNYLKGETDFGRITQPVSEVYGLYVITGGEIDSDPVSLLSNDRMEFLANQGAKAFDYVIIDAPPVIGFADTLLLTSIATSTLIVANDNSLDNRMVKTVLEKLARIKNNLLGFLLVNVKNPEARDNFYLDYPEKPITQLLLKSD